MNLPIIGQSTFLSIWKEAYMFPVHKKGDRKNVNNYRGISPLCATAKLFDSATGSQTDFIYTDLSATLEKVNHKTAIAKLGRIGIRGSLLEWFYCYQVGRKLIVRNDQVNSHEDFLQITGTGSA
ncbi:uncharacterized protein LOC129760093 [Uranotaenia lowii]|uniref:uncharacterized protein LOC129760093 n=1 Tax=Uranotaenia lowii TaxID=190385 RepID=UPI002479B8A7|nr:uncharacterized protein LOC129760093 [Uranotaenia lowii]